MASRSESRSLRISSIDAYYQWRLRGNGHPVSDKAYFVYCNAPRDRASFEDKLDFWVEVFEYVSDDSWIEPTIRAAKVLLDGDDVPEITDCQHCTYAQKASSVGKG